MPAYKGLNENLALRNLPVDRVLSIAEFGLTGNYYDDSAFTDKDIRSLKEKGVGGVSLIDTEYGKGSPLNYKTVVEELERRINDPNVSNEQKTKLKDVLKKYVTPIKDPNAQFEEGLNPELFPGLNPDNVKNIYHEASMGNAIGNMFSSPGFWLAALPVAAGMAGVGAPEAAGAGASGGAETFAASQPAINTAGITPIGESTVWVEGIGQVPAAEAASAGLTGTGAAGAAGGAGATAVNPVTGLMEPVSADLAAEAGMSVAPAAGGGESMSWLSSLADTFDMSTEDLVGTALDLGGTIYYMGQADKASKRAASAAEQSAQNIRDLGFASLNLQRESINEYYKQRDPIRKIGLQALSQYTAALGLPNPGLKYLPTKPVGQLDPQAEDYGEEYVEPEPEAIEPVTFPWKRTPPTYLRKIK